MSKKKILHVSNVANNAYCNARLLEKNGHESHVISHDFYHFAASPEWQELRNPSIRQEHLGDQMFADLWTIPAQDRFRPAWFAQGPAFLCITYLILLNRSDPRAALALECLEYQRFKAIIHKTTFPQTVLMSEAELEEAMRPPRHFSPDEKARMHRARAFDDFVGDLRRVASQFYDAEVCKTLSPPFSENYLDGFASADAAFREKLDKLRADRLAFPAGIEIFGEIPAADMQAPSGARAEDFAVYKSVLPWWKELTLGYDQVIYYGIDPIIPYLMGRNDYICYEYGTIRELPFYDTTIGRLTRLAYEQAGHVFITNADYITANRRITLDPERVTFLPHAFDEKPLVELKEQSPRAARMGRVVEFFGPARQDWVKADPQMSKGNHLVVDAAAVIKAEGRLNFVVTFVDWGVDAQRTRERISDLGLEEHFRWTPPMPKRELWRRYLGSHAVIDQFLLPAMGSVQFEALALGARVITFDDGVTNKTFFGAAPPVLTASTVEQIAACLRQVLDDPEDAAGVGEASARWIMAYHSGRRQLELQEAAFAVAAKIATDQSESITRLGGLLDKVRRTDGKLPSILHMGNISNLAYGNAKLLNRAGYDSYVICHDFYHFAAAPEWQELTGSSVRKEDFGEDFFANFFFLPPNVRVRPEWFVQGPQYACILYLHSLLTHNHVRIRRSQAALEYMRLKALVRNTTMPWLEVFTDAQFEAALQPLQLSDVEVSLLREGRIMDEFTAHLYAAMNKVYDAATVTTIGAPLHPSYLDSFFSYDAEFAAYIKSRRSTGELADYGFEIDPALMAELPSFPRDARLADAEPYRLYASLWRTLFDLFDMVIFYATFPMFGYLAGMQRYFAYEHGTIRSIPFEDDAVGRLTRLGYENADAVFITNSDYISAERKLEFRPNQAYYLPHTYDIEPIRAFNRMHADVRPRDGRTNFFHPARQDWVNYDPSMSKGNDRLILAAAAMRDRSYHDFLIEMVAWGQDLQASKDLIHDLKMEDYFLWTDPLAKRDLWLRYMTSHAVIDQFFISSISGVSYEALALGRPVITCDDGIANRVFFGEQPPLLAASTPAEITDRLLQVIHDPLDSAKIGQASASWIERRHGPARIVEIQTEAFANALEV